MSDPGQFVWYELATPDPVTAAGFYEHLAGWKTHDSQMPGMTYLLADAGDDQVAGMMTLPEQAKAMGAPPHWLGYVGVEDVDGSAEQVKSLGGQLYAGPMDIPGVGRFAVCADPQGAAFALFKPANVGDRSPADDRKSGHFAWRELVSSDPVAGLAFYGALFGWKKGEAHNMGDMGVYQLFETASGQTLGGMMKRPPGVPASFWLYYINVGDIDPALERAKAGGAEILMGPTPVPGGGWIVQGRDPQKAHFALVGMRA